jgi:uncharacterized protein with PIN domain
MVSVTFRFHHELNDFLALHHRGKEIVVACPDDATAKHMIEALGIPHTEVGAIEIDGGDTGFERRLHEGERVDVYPENGPARSLHHLRGAMALPPGFIADAHLGGLARLMRMAGFDTLYDNGYADASIEAIAVQESRIVLSRDRELLKRRAIVHGCFPHALEPPPQFRQVCARFALAPLARPFTRCLACNAPLRDIDKSQVLERLPASVREHQQAFSTCDVCRRVYWQGSHWRRMRDLLEPLLAT